MAGHHEGAAAPLQTAWRGGGTGLGCLGRRSADNPTHNALERQQPSQPVSCAPLGCMADGLGGGWRLGFLAVLCHWDGGAHGARRQGQAAGASFCATAPPCCRLPPGPHPAARPICSSTSHSPARAARRSWRLRMTPSCEFASICLPPAGLSGCGRRGPACCSCSASRAFLSACTSAGAPSTTSACRRRWTASAWARCAAPGAAG